MSRGSDAAAKTVTRIMDRAAQNWKNRGLVMGKVVTLTLAIFKFNCTYVWHGAGSVRETSMVWSFLERSWFYGIHCKAVCHLRIRY